MPDVFDSNQPITVEDIRSLISRVSPNATWDHLEAGASLLEAGALDSIGIIDLLGHIESEYDIRVPEADLIPDHFDSLQSIASYLTRFRRPPGP